MILYNENINILNNFLFIQEASQALINAKLKAIQISGNIEYTLKYDEKINEYLSRAEELKIIKSKINEKIDNKSSIKSKQDVKKIFYSLTNI